MTMTPHHPGQHDHADGQEGLFAAPAHTHVPAQRTPAPPHPPAGRRSTTSTWSPR